MALSTNYTWRGVTINDAYIRVDHILGGKREGRITPEMPGEQIWSATVGIYADSAQDVPITTLSVIVPMVIEDTPFDTIYTHLKTLPEFTGATDC
jgi:hypothetical protein